MAFCWGGIEMSHHRKSCSVICYWQQQNNWCIIFYVGLLLWRQHYEEIIFCYVVMFPTKLPLLSYRLVCNLDVWMVLKFIDHTKPQIYLLSITHLANSCFRKKNIKNTFSLIQQQNLYQLIAASTWTDPNWKFSQNISPSTQRQKEKNDKNDWCISRRY